MDEYIPIFNIPIYIPFPNIVVYLKYFEINSDNSFRELGWLNDEIFRITEFIVL